MSIKHRDGGEGLWGADRGGLFMHLHRSLAAEPIGLLRSLLQKLKTLSEHYRAAVCLEVRIWKPC
jgi:hypothetical protein